MAKVENAPVHLTVSIRQDGVWLNFRASTGKHASLRIESLGEERRGIIGRALLDWCADQRANVLAQQIYDPRFDGDPSTWPLHNPAMPRSIEPPPKGWCEKMAQLEGDHEIGAGALAVDPEPLDDAPAQQPQISDEAAEKIVMNVVRDVAELPDRTSPPDEPMLLLVTERELLEILRYHLGRAAISAAIEWRK